MSKKSKQLTNVYNKQTFDLYYNQLSNLALNVFKWENLPEEIDYRYLEWVLYTRGYCLFFQDEVTMKYLTLECAIGGNFNVYRIPKYRRAYSISGYQAERNDKNSVIIFNNYLHNPSNIYIQQYARRLALIERTLDINTNAQKTPIMIVCDENQQLSMKNLYQQYDGNEPIIFANKNSGISEGVKVLNTQAPPLFDKLQVLKHQIMNEALTFLGIENSNSDKKERLVEAEVGSNYGNVEMQRFVFLNARRQACEQINRMFGLNVEVKYNSELPTMLNSSNMGLQLSNTENTESEVKNNG